MVQSKTNPPPVVLRKMYVATDEDSANAISYKQYDTEGWLVFLTPDTGLCSLVEPGRPVFFKMPPKNIKDARIENRSYELRSKEEGIFFSYKQESTDEIFVNGAIIEVPHLMQSPSIIRMGEQYIFFTHQPDIPLENKEILEKKLLVELLVRSYPTYKDTLDAVSASIKFDHILILKDMSAFHDPISIWTYIIDTFQNQETQRVLENIQSTTQRQYSTINQFDVNSNSEFSELEKINNNVSSSKYGETDDDESTVIAKPEDISAINEIPSNTGDAVLEDEKTVDMMIPSNISDLSELYGGYEQQPILNSNESGYNLPFELRDEDNLQAKNDVSSVESLEKRTDYVDDELQSAPIAFNNKLHKPNTQALKQSDSANETVTDTLLKQTESLKNDYNEELETPSEFGNKNSNTKPTSYKQNFSKNIIATFDEAKEATSQDDFSTLSSNDQDVKNNHSDSNDDLFETTKEELIPDIPQDFALNNDLNDLGFASNDLDERQPPPSPIPQSSRSDLKTAPLVPPVGQKNLKDAKYMPAVKILDIEEVTPVKVSAKNKTVPVIGVLSSLIVFLLFVFLGMKIFSNSDQEASKENSDNLNKIVITTPEPHINTKDAGLNGSSSGLAQESKQSPSDKTVAPAFAVLNFLGDNELPVYSAQNIPVGATWDPKSKQILSQNLTSCTWIAQKERSFKTKGGKIFRYIRCKAGSNFVEGWINKAALNINDK